MHSNKFYLVLAIACVAVFSTHGRAEYPFESNIQSLGMPEIAQDETVPDVTARVARISFITGDAQVKHVDSQDWERVVLNLPLVEGDEISTATGSRVEIQFDADSYARLTGDSYVKINTLTEEGIALSLSQGRGSFRLFRFDLSKAYFEVDAPGTTVAPQKAGLYSVNSGNVGSSDVRVTVTESGEARVYSESSGFLLRDGRTALLQVGGPNPGEFESGRAEASADEFDAWSLTRDAAISKALQNAAYDKYYDRDIYGAEDLNSYGEWIHTQKYGYVWRPSASATSVYSAWSPYRYGQWRWIPPYGWTWVNDEPWGWATYHHGRWLFDDGYWYWSPYGAFRNTHSWWSPALVYVTIYSGNVCWYPLPYTYAYYNYNYYYNQHNGWQPPGSGHNGAGGAPTPTPTPSITGGGTLVTSRLPHPPLGIVPPAGVVTLPADQFGRVTKGNLAAPLSVATGVLSRVPEVARTAPVLPTASDVRQRGAREILVPPPSVASRETARTGAAARRPGEPLDQDLRTTRIFGGRTPAKTPSIPLGTVPGSVTGRPTGAVDRPASVTRPTSRAPVVSMPPADRSARDVPPVRQDPPATRAPAPRYEPPVRQDPPSSRPPNPEPPVNRQPPARQEPPAAKPEPKPDVKPPMESRKKDGN
jgi:FecR protein